MENTTESMENMNKSLFFIQPHSDPDLAECTGFYLKSDLAVRKNVFVTFFYVFQCDVIVNISKLNTLRLMKRLYNKHMLYFESQLVRILNVIETMIITYQRGVITSC